MNLTLSIDARSEVFRIEELRGVLGSTTTNEYATIEETMRSHMMIRRRD